MSKNKNVSSSKSDSAQGAALNGDSGYAWAMSYAPKIEEPTIGLQLIPAILFTSIVIMLVRMYNYSRDMSRFYWSGGNDTLVDFFSHYKVVLIVICTVLALLMLLYRLVTQSLAIKRTILYAPIAVYTLFVLLSYVFSSEKLYAWNGWNDRFEGTFTILCYMVMLFFIINSINNELNVKWMIYPTAAIAGLLSLLGISQFLNQDFFRTTIGQKMLMANYVPAGGTSSTWQLVDQAAAEGKQMLTFTFQNREIYQTVYNINYVSFYLTLLIPLFGMLFIREKNLIKKTIWGVLITMILINLIGSASSGGILGMFFVVVMAVIVLNVKLLKWWKSVTVLLALTVLVAAGTHVYMTQATGRSWMNEVSGAVAGALKHNTPVAMPATPGFDAEEAAPAVQKLDYFINDGFDIIFSVNGEEAVITTNPDDPGTFSVRDKSGAELTLESVDIQFSKEEGAGTNPGYMIRDPRFSTIELIPATSAQEDESAEALKYCIFKLTDEDTMTWPFVILKDGAYLHNQLGKYVKLKKVPSVGWANNPGFGSGRGYIWSRTLPMLSQTIFVGYGADTYCIFYPQNDYVGKYNAGWNVNTIVDKPHNMYLGAAVGTGVISVLALWALFLLYFIQSVKLYRKEEFKDFSSVVGVGIFLGTFGFAISGFVDDSTVSVMPMFYGLLGLGIAINIFISRKSRA